MGAAGKLSSVYFGSSSHNWSEWMRRKKALEQPLPRAEPLTKSWHNYAVKSTLLFKNPKAHITKTHSRPALPLALTVLINYPDWWGHESCNFNSTPGDALHVCLSAGGTTWRVSADSQREAAQGRTEGAAAKFIYSWSKTVCTTLNSHTGKNQRRQTDREKQQ